MLSVVRDPNPRGRAGDLQKGVVAHFGTSQQLECRGIAREWSLQDSLRPLSRNIARMDAHVFQAFYFEVRQTLLGFKQAPALVVHETELTAQSGQA